MCWHLRACREPWIKYVRWYVPSGLKMELLCDSCAGEREKDLPVAAEFVCEECLEYATNEVGDLVIYLDEFDTAVVTINGQPVEPWSD